MTYWTQSIFILFVCNFQIFSRKMTPQSLMSIRLFLICPSIWNQNPSATQNHAYLPICLSLDLSDISNFRSFLDCRSCITDLVSQILCCRSCVADLGLQILDYRSCRSWIADLGSQIFDLRSWISDLRSQILDLKSWISDLGFLRYLSIMISQIS